MSATRIAVVLPFAPDQRAEHDRLLAAAALLAGGDGGDSGDSGDSGDGGDGGDGGVSGGPRGAVSLDVVQLGPAEGGGSPRSARAATTWWQCVAAEAVADAEPEILASLACAALVATGAPAPTLVLLPPGPEGEKLAALVAAGLGGRSLGRCASLVLDGARVRARRAAFGGRVALDLVAPAGPSAPCCATLRAGSRGLPTPAPLPASAVRALRVSAPVGATTGADRVVETLPGTDDGPRLEGAPLVVSGGRGLDGPEGFALLARVAGALGAALGGSLPAVDAGWVPVARQVGQSGKFVAPKVYFAVGISGTPQHMAGVSDETRVVALNSDPDAPIFARAEVGVAGDWREILPLLAERLEARQD